MKILIIEDEKDLREVMTRSLEKERFVVETAADYSTALQKSMITTTTVSCWTSCSPGVAVCRFWKS